MAQLAVAFAAPGLLGSVFKFGLFAASVAGSFLAPDQKSANSTRLNDLKVSSSAYGQGIAIVYGTMRVPGNMFWATPFKEVKQPLNKKAKKGKSESKGAEYGYEYFANFAMGLCEGPMTEVLRIWADSNLIYDKYNADDEDVVGPGFTVESEDNGKGKTGGKGKKGGSQDSGRFSFRFYPGSEDQGIDPFMESKTGAGLQPAHRGLCYLVFEDFALADFGNRIPTITAEVTSFTKRKPITSVFQQDLNLPTTDRDNGNSKVFIDPIRGNILGFWVDDYLCRVFSLERKTENAGYRLTPVIEETSYYFNAFNEFRTGETGVPIGIAHTGDLVVAMTGDNNKPVAFYDTINPKPTVALGARSTLLTPSYGNFGPAQCAVPIPFSTAFGTILVTGVFALFGGVVFLGPNELEPLGWMAEDSSVGIPNTEKVFPGIPNENGETPVYMQKDGALWRFDLKIIGTSLKMKDSSGIWRSVGSWDGDVVEPEGQYGGVLVFDTGSVTAAGRAVAMYGPQCIAMVYQKDGRLFAVKIDAFDDSVLWHEDIGEFTGLISGASNSIDIIPPIMGNKYYLRKSGSLTVVEVDFASETSKQFSIPDDAPDASSDHFYWSPTNSFIEFGVDPTKEDSTRTWRNLRLDTMVQTKASSESILRDVSERVGITQAQVNTANLDEDSLTGYIVQNPTAAKSVVEDMIKLFMFDIVESDFQVKAISRGSASVVNVPQRDLGVVSDSDSNVDNANDYFRETRLQEIELPQTVNVTYLDAKEDYQNSSQHFRRPRSPMAVMQSRDKLDINFPISMDSTMAKQTAEKILYSVWAERVSYEFVLPWKYLKYDPADVMTYTMDSGLTFEVRMGTMDVGADFSIQADGIGQSSATYTSAAVGVNRGGFKPQLTVPPLLRPIILDIPYLSDTDNIGAGNFNLYMGVGAYGTGMRYGLITYKKNGDSQQGGTFYQDAVWGRTLGNLPPPPYGAATDVDTQLTVAPTYDYEAAGSYTWESIPDAEWPSDENTIVINGEIIFFKEVTDNGDGSFTLSHLIRGARGTLPFAYLHKPNVSYDFVLPSSAIRGESESYGYTGGTTSFRADSGGSLFPSPVKSYSLVGNSHKPYAPSGFRRTDDAGVITFEWERQTRLNGGLMDGTGTVPLNEEYEAYELYFVRDAVTDMTTFDPTNLEHFARKVELTAQTSFEYTAAMQLEDGVSIEPLRIVVYQISADVGRGFPGRAKMWTPA